VYPRLYSITKCAVILAAGANAQFWDYEGEPVKAQPEKSPTARVKDQTEETVEAQTEESQAATAKAQPEKKTYSQSSIKLII
jgi:hypothetical protein